MVLTAKEIGLVVNLKITLFGVCERKKNDGEKARQSTASVQNFILYILIKDGRDFRNKESFYNMTHHFLKSEGREDESTEVCSILYAVLGLSYLGLPGSNQKQQNSSHFS